MNPKVTLDWHGETITLFELARRHGMNHGCLLKRWHRGLRGDDLVAPPRVTVRQPPKTFEQREELADMEHQRSIARSRKARKQQLRQRERDKAIRVAKEHAAAFAKPLIDGRLLTPAERKANRAKVRGCQRWNGGWFGESHDSREAR